MLRVGLTGGIGSGKSEVSRRLAERGAVVVDADLLAREVVEPGTAGLADVVEAFGEKVLGPDGRLDRPALGRLIFGDDAARRRLEGIIHPRVRQRARQIQEDAPADAVVVHDNPLLVEMGQAGDFDAVVVVDAPDDVRLDRLVRLRGMSPEDAQARIAAQASRQERLAVADHVVRNDGGLSTLDAAVDELWDRLVAVGARKP
jgi:dephospho-CoA kinase